MKANSEWYSLCDIYVHCTLGLVKWDLWGFGAESWFVVASYAFAKMELPLVMIAAPLANALVSDSRIENRIEKSLSYAMIKANPIVLIFKICS